MDTEETANRFYWLLIGAAIATCALIVYLGIRVDPRFMEMIRAATG